jgi:hypothetical protein
MTLRYRAPTSAAPRLTAALAALATLALGASSRALESASAPTLTKIPEYLVLAPLPDGRLMGIFDRASAGGAETAARYSTDEGRSWSDAVTLFGLPAGHGGWGLHRALVDRTGELHLFYTSDANTGTVTDLYQKRYDVWHAASENGRKGWRPPNLVREGYYGSMLSVIELRGGRIVLPVCYLTPRRWASRGAGFDAFAFMGRFSSSVLYSDDSGRTWRQSDIEFKTPTPTIGADGMIEPIALELQDGRVWLLIRTQLGRLFESFSPDGSAWSPPRPTSILSSDSPPSLVRLKDGRIVMLWNHCQRFSYAAGGRHVLHGAVSEDEGRTWRGYREVARNPLLNEPPPPRGDHGVSYTTPGLTARGTIVTPVSVGGAGGFYLLHLAPEWLLETGRTADFARAFDDWSTFGTRGVQAVDHPDRPGEKVLSLRKTEPAWPSGAVWNFPSGTTGRLRLRLRLQPGFTGGAIGLTDHFSVPFDFEDEVYNLYHLAIGPGGRLAGSGRLEPGRWHELAFDWDTARGECRVQLDGRPAARLRQSRLTTGACYLRLRSTADSTDAAGLLVESVKVEVGSKR